MLSFATYDPLPEEGRVYRKTTTIRAVRMHEPFEVRTNEGLMKGGADDLLAQGIEGELYVIMGSVFDRTYEEVR